MKSDQTMAIKHLTATAYGAVYGVISGGAGLAYSFVRQGLKVRPANALFNVAAFTFVSGPTFQLRETIRARSGDSTRGKAFDT
ncbi:unnamed protein product [Brassica rapa]|uniref:Uncharacterized protein n=1 Tax=Brassica campestris TaxID=3711 RepID=A0A8D9MCU0_BRACM|nr:unnamed protein product [Brassica rapa]